MCKKAKWLSEEALQIAEKRRETKGKGKKETHNLYVLLNSNFFVLNVFSIPFTLWYSEFPVNLQNLVQECITSSMKYPLILANICM